MLTGNHIQISMEGTGKSIDNIAIERFFRTLIYNCRPIFMNDLKNIKALKDGISDYIDKYNYKIFQSSISYEKPMSVYLDYIQNYKHIAA